MHNYEAAVFAQATVEMQRLVARLGGDPSTAAGLAGVGDLDVTCNGGRTGRFGRLLGLGHSVPEAISRMEGATLECLEVLAVLRQAFAEDATGRLRADDFPLLGHLGAVAFDGRPVDVPFESFVGA
jgi:glycerol-3-phosphate dehydrogenase (NAD(P)+)